jgi:hypothetical protein
VLQIRWYLASFVLVLSTADGCAIIFRTLFPEEPAQRAAQCELMVRFVLSNSTTRHRLRETVPNWPAFAAFERTGRRWSVRHLRIMGGKIDLSRGTPPRERKSKTGWRRGRDSNSWLSSRCLRVRFALFVRQIRCSPETPATKRNEFARLTGRRLVDANSRFSLCFETQLRDPISGGDGAVDANRWLSYLSRTPLRDPASEKFDPVGTLSPRRREPLHTTGR